jgi:hypothetical protein
VYQCACEAGFLSSTEVLHLPVMAGWTQQAAELPLILFTDCVWHVCAQLNSHVSENSLPAHRMCAQQHVPG